MHCRLKPGSAFAVCHKGESVMYYNQMDGCNFGAQDDLGPRECDCCCCPGPAGPMGPQGIPGPEGRQGGGVREAGGEADRPERNRTGEGQGRDAPEETEGNERKLKEMKGNGTKPEVCGTGCGRRPEPVGTWWGTGGKSAAVSGLRRSGASVPQRRCTGAGRPVPRSRCVRCGACRG